MTDLIIKIIPSTKEVYRFIVEMPDGSAITNDGDYHNTEKEAIKQAKRAIRGHKNSNEFNIIVENK